MGCRRSNLVPPLARQISYLLFYCSGSSPHISPLLTTTRLTSHCTSLYLISPLSPHFSLHTSLLSSPHITSPLLTSPHLTLLHLCTPHHMLPHLSFTTPHFTSFTSPRLTTSHLYVFNFLAPNLALGT